MSSFKTERQKEQKRAKKAREAIRRAYSKPNDDKVVDEGRALREKAAEAVQGSDKPVAHWVGLTKARPADVRRWKAGRGMPNDRQAAAINGGAS